MNKVLIALTIIIVLAGLIGCLVWWLSKSDNKTYEHERTIPYSPPNQELVHKKMDAEVLNQKDSSIIPKVVYMTYHNIDMIPPDVLENVKKYCKGYRIEIHGDQSCEDFLYNYYGPDAMQLFRELKVGTHKECFWRYCILYGRGGYSLDIKAIMRVHMDEIGVKSEERTWFSAFGDMYPDLLVSPPFNPDLWRRIIKSYYAGKEDTGKANIGNEWVHTELDPKILHTIQWDSSDRENLLRIHSNLPSVDVSKLDIPILYINMDRDTDRRKFIERELRNVKTVHRVPGVLYYDIKSFPKCSITKAEIGCFMAHINACKTILSKGWEKALIIEDDTSLRLSRRWDRPLSQIQTPSLLGVGNTGYILDNTTAKLLVEKFYHTDKISLSVDDWMWETLGILRDDEAYSEGYLRNCNIRDLTVKRDRIKFYNLYPAVYPYKVEQSTTMYDRERNHADSWAFQAALNIIDLFPLSSIQINEDGVSTKNQGKRRVALVSTLSFHHECLGFLADMYSNFAVEIYHNGEVNTEDYVKFFSDKYKCKYFYIKSSNIHGKDFSKIVILTTWDKIRIKQAPPYSKKLIYIKHVKEGEFDDYITLTSLVDNPVGQKIALSNPVVLPVYHGDKKIDRKKQILIIGTSQGMDDTNLVDLAQSLNYKIIVAKRVREDMDGSHPNLHYYYGASAKELGRSGFRVVIHINTQEKGQIFRRYRYSSKLRSAYDY